MDQITATMRELHISGMAAAWESMRETRKSDSLTLTDGLQLLLQAETDARRENRNARLQKQAKFRYTCVIDEIDFDPLRGIERSIVMRMATGDYIRQGLPVILTGPAGTGKSFLATAFGQQACLMGLRVRYFGVQKLFEEITVNRIAGTLPRFFDRLSHTELLIIDDFGLRCLDPQQMLDFMEIIEDRQGRCATIFVSQVPVTNWMELMAENTTATEAIFDRIVHTAIRFDLKEESCRRK
ncbi:MAG: IS21-like element helper ATPase IstB [Bacteroidales bacterium]